MFRRILTAVWSRNQETSEEANVPVLERGDGDLQGHGNGKKWLDLEHVLVVEFGEKHNQG